MAKPVGSKAPTPGEYTGIVDGCVAMFSVSRGPLPGITAWWIEKTRDGQPFICSDAWDITDGRFQPRRNGRPVHCSFRKAG